MQKLGDVGVLEVGAELLGGTTGRRKRRDSGCW